MTDEVSQSFHISIIVMCTAALISAVIAISTMSLNIMGSYADKYNQAVGESTDTGIYALVKAGDTPVPVIYSTVMQGINAVDVIRLTVKTESGTVVSNQIIYQFNDMNKQNITALLSKYRLYTGRVTVTPGEISGAMITVNVEVVQ